MDDNSSAMIFEKLVKYSLDIICAIDRQGKFLFVNKVCENIIGYTSEELINQHYTKFIHPEYRELTRVAAQNIISGANTNNFENCFIHKNGQQIRLQWSVFWSGEDETFFCVAREAMAQEMAWQKLKEEKELHQTLIEHTSDGIALLDEAGNYIYVSSSIRNSTGYEPDDLIGKNAFERIHPDDLPNAQEYWSELATKKQVEFFDFRFRDANGEWLWFETIVNNQLHNPAIRAVVVNSRNITERKISSFQLAESEQRFRSLFENNPDMILIENHDGIIVDVNPATANFINLPRKDLINRPLSDFLPPDITTICMSHLQKALAGNTTKFVLELPVNDNKDKVILDVLKVPVQVNGQITGVYSILSDITAITQYHNTIKEQAKKLNTIFESITDAFFTLDKNWHFTYINSEFDRILEVEHRYMLGKEIREFFPEERNQVFFQQYRYALENNKSVHFEAYYPEKDIWVEVKAFPSEEGLSVYFDDVTEKVKAKHELEKLSLVASKTTNSILISDANGHIEWVNDSFTQLMGYALPDLRDKKLTELFLGPATDKQTINLVREKIIFGEPSLTEILVYKKMGEPLWISQNITPVLNDADKVSRFIVIQTDITARKEAEAAQLKLTNDLYRQNRDMQQFTYIVSHNLRAPVANALGYAQLLVKVDKNTNVFDKSLANLKTSIIRLDTLLKDLNLILSIQDNKETIDKEKVDVALVCQQAISSVQESLQACGAKVTMELKEETFLHGNKAYFYSIFYNLLTNAIKYRSPERPLQITITSIISASAGTIISFADNGSGFDQEKVGKNIFKLYKRFHSSAEGRGIGLFLVKSHIESLGGHIEVQSQVNQGTKFLIFLK